MCLKLNGWKKWAIWDLGVNNHLATTQNTLATKSQRLGNHLEIILASFCTDKHRNSDNPALFYCFHVIRSSIISFCSNYLLIQMPRISFQMFNKLGDIIRKRLKLHKKRQKRLFSAPFIQWVCNWRTLIFRLHTLRCSCDLRTLLASYSINTIKWPKILHEVYTCWFSHKHFKLELWCFN